MQGKRKGVATRVRDECPAAVPVHCFAHSLNLCLQDCGRKIPLVRNAIDITREIAQLINFSPKRSHLFNEKLAQEEHGVSLKLLCPTRWTARTVAIEAILKDYSVLMDTLEEVSETTHDEYGSKAAGLLANLEKFDIFWGLKLSYLLFGAAEEVSKFLQTEDISIQSALSSVNMASAFYSRQRKPEAFKNFYNEVVKSAEKIGIGKPQLPRSRRAPCRLDSGSNPHQFTSPCDYYRQIYFEACDLLQQELCDRFDQSELLPPVLAMESLLLKAANSENYDQHLETLKSSCFAADFDFAILKRHLSFLVDVISNMKPRVKKVTCISTICDGMNNSPSYKEMLSEVHKILRLFLTIPITSSTAERTFSAMKRLLSYLRSSMTEKRLNNCLLLYIHKDSTDELDVIELAKDFISINAERNRFFGSFV